MYDQIAKCLPRDHARQSVPEDLVKALVAQGFRPKNVIDLGCGTGGSVAFFRRVLPEAEWIGVDVEHSHEVSQRTRTDAKFVTFDGVHLPFQEKTAELIFSRQVLEHVRHPEPLLAEAARVLHPDGYLVGSTSNLEPFHSESFWNFTPFGFKVIAEAAGLEVLQLRPGIDALTLILRSYLAKPKFFSQWFESESPLNNLIDSWGGETRRSPAQINARKLQFCGHFSFLARVRDPSRSKSA